MENYINSWGLILAGGHSTRMGQNKALLKLSGETLLSRAYKTMLKFCETCYVSSSEEYDYPDFPQIKDRVTGFGPIAGITRGLELAQINDIKILRVLACDQPFLTKEFLEKLKPDLSGKLAWVFQEKATGKLEMTAAVFSVDSLGYFQGAIKNNQRSLWNILPIETISITPYDEADAWRFFNCNNIQDWEQVKLQESSLNK